MSKDSKICIALIALVPLSAAHAGNILSNPNFDSDLEGWATSEGVAWTSEHDHHGAGSLGEGSAQVSVAGTNEQTLVQCVSVAPSTDYYFGVWVYGSPDRTGAGGLIPGCRHFITVSQAGSADCEITGHSDSTASTIGKDGGWELRALGVSTTEVTTWLRVELGSHCDSGGSTVYFDDPFVLEEEVAENGFESR